MEKVTWRRSFWRFLAPQLVDVPFIEPRESSHPGLKCSTRTFRKIVSLGEQHEKAHALAAWLVLIASPRLLGTNSFSCFQDICRSADTNLHPNISLVSCVTFGPCFVRTKPISIYAKVAGPIIFRIEALPTTSTYLQILQTI